jgi:hypothetical protein
MQKHPLAEVFGFPCDNMSIEAKRYRNLKLCPFNNKVPNCTKDKANDPLGVCSIYEASAPVITCPIRFRENWQIAEDAAKFFFQEGTNWTSLTEVRLADAEGKSAGNIDLVLVSYDASGKITGFGAVEVQAVYISGNVRRPFATYMADPEQMSSMDWTNESNYPRADYLSSSRKRLAPQLIYKGGILKTWNRKTAVVLNDGFFSTLPKLKSVKPEDADIAWLVYGLSRDEVCDSYRLHLEKAVYTKFDNALDQITRSTAGNEETFLNLLQNKLDDKLDSVNPPDIHTIDEDI